MTSTLPCAARHCALPGAGVASQLAILPCPPPIPGVFGLPQALTPASACGCTRTRRQGRGTATILFSTVFQFAYTYLFGSFASYVFLRSGHLPTIILYAPLHLSRLALHAAAVTCCPRGGRLSALPLRRLYSRQPLRAQPATGCTGSATGWASPTSRASCNTSTSCSSAPPCSSASPASTISLWHGACRKYVGQQQVCRPSAANTRMMI